jgi:hypothetical protein
VKFKGENAKTYTYEQLMEAAEVETAKYGIETYYPLEEVRSQYDTPLIFGTNPYPIRFMGKTADFTVNIVKEIAGIAINTPPSKASYTVGLETLDLAGLSVTVSYNDDREPVTVNYTGNENDFSVDSLLVSRVGENANTYAVAYKGFETTFSVAGTSPIPQAPPGGEGPDIPAITLPEPDQGGGEPPVPVAVEQEVAAGETVYFAFMPTKAGTYRFSVKGGDGADAYLFDSEGNMLAYRLVTDDGQTNTSGIGTLAASPSVTILEYELEGNTNYYVGAKFQSTTETGKIGVSAEEVERPPDVIRGDVNGDGEVDPLDLTRLRKYLVNKDTAISFEAADINDDKLVDPLDLTRLRKYLGRAIDSL